MLRFFFSLFILLSFLSTSVEHFYHYFIYYTAGIILAFFILHILPHFGPKHLSIPAVPQLKKIYLPTFLKNDSKLETIFLQSTFGMIVHILGADKIITQAEIEAIEHVAHTVLQLTPEQTEQAKSYFKEAQNSERTFSSFANELYSRFKKAPSLLTTVIYILLEMALASNEVTEREEELLAKAVDIFHLPPFYFQIPVDGGEVEFSISGRTAKSRANKPKKKIAFAPLSPYETLGISPDASLEDAEKAYKRLAKTYHPDTLTAKGLPKDFIPYANKRFREIHQAWEDIKALKEAMAPVTTSESKQK